MPNLFARLLSWIGFALVAGFILVTTVRAESPLPHVSVAMPASPTTHSGRFPAARSFGIEKTTDGWASAPARRLANGGIDDHIVTRR